jgi:two-component system nitrate/nitrite response regulator NarL
MSKNTPIQVAVLEDHQSIIDGYLYRLNLDDGICVACTAQYGEALEPMLSKHKIDVLLLDVYVPTSPTNRTPYPILHAIPDLLKKYQGIRILTISVATHPTLIQALVDAGISGYVLKHDQESIQQLANIVAMIARGGMYFSQEAHLKLRKNPPAGGSTLSPRQLEILSLCASYPDISTTELAVRLGIASSTVRNILFAIYSKLGVHTKAAAITRAQQLGLISGSRFDEPEDESNEL